MRQYREEEKEIVAVYGIEQDAEACVERNAISDWNAGNTDYTIDERIVY
jgi:hypothetical protein